VLLRFKNIAAAANEILAAACEPDESPSTVSENWPTKWLNRHSEFAV
jgi:hypothetical protein